MIRHAGWLITMFQVKVDGKTPHERLRHRPYRGEVAEFGETVHNKLPVADLGKADGRWSIGIWLGKTLKSDEHIVGTGKGAPHVDPFGGDQKASAGREKRWTSALEHLGNPCHRAQGSEA